VAAYSVEGIHVSDFFAALVAAFFLGILNAFVRPILLILTLPINLVTFGLFTFVVNALLLMAASGAVKGFEVRGFWSAVLGSVIISLANWALTTLSSNSPRGSRRNGDGDHDDHIDLRRGDDGRWK
ncbi:MAG: phage holin family protein, partial [Deltaproteobacteria bacterium]|nr:phage holin family protein [Deltaproteobacteria bacterium]